MGNRRGRKWYPRVKVVCQFCNWKATRTTYMQCKPCPRCGGMIRPIKPE